MKSLTVKQLKKEAQVVYFIHDEPKKFIKIGTTMSSNLTSRMISIQGSNPYDLFLLGLLPGGHQDELKFHHQFKMHWKRGEWFYYHPDIVALFDKPLHRPISTLKRIPGICITFYE